MAGLHTWGFYDSFSDDPILMVYHNQGPTIGYYWVGNNGMLSLSDAESLIIVINKLLFYVGFKITTENFEGFELELKKYLPSSIHKRLNVLIGKENIKFGCI